MKMLNFHEIHMNSAYFRENQDFYVTETPASAESTKPYELLGQIDEISTQNHFLTGNHFSLEMHFSKKDTLHRNIIS